MKHRWIAIAAVIGMVVLGGCAPTEPGGAGDESASPSTAAKSAAPSTAAESATPAPADNGGVDDDY
jgi:hypothetical protein